LFAFALLASRRAGTLCLAFVLVSFVALTWWLRPADPFKFWGDPIILEFVFGMLLALAFMAGVRLPRILAFGIVAAALIALFEAPRLNLAVGPRGLQWGVPAACIVGALVFAKFRGSQSSVGRALVFVGDSSYALYLLHPLTGPLLRRFFPGLVDPVAHPWLYATILLTVALAVSMAVHALLEKPFTRMLQHRIRSHFAARESDTPPQRAVAIVPGTARNTAQ
jgi:peptidoglycan/LPS O-acetylase OafA/YrhL